jgi:hypothetical protein
LFSFFVKVELLLCSPPTKGKNPNRFRKIKFHFSARWVRLVSCVEQAKADSLLKSCSSRREELAYLRGEPAFQELWE